MLKAVGLVDENDIPNFDTLAAYGDVLDLEMPAEAKTNEEKLQVLVDNAGVIRDAVVQLANICQRKVGKGKGKGKGKGSRRVCKKLGNIQKLRVVVDNAKVTRDAIVELAPPG